MAATARARPLRKPPPVSPQADPVMAYARAVIAGEIVAGRLVRLAAERHLRDLMDGPARGLTFDRGKARRAIEFFALLRLPDGAAAGQPFILQPWQAFIVGSLFGWQRADGRRRFRYALVEVARANGKALALDTPIPTPSGWATQGELKPGDAVFDEAGLSCNVTGVTPVMYERPCYEVEFNDGSKIVADAEHEWFTYARLTGAGHGVALKGRPRSEWFHTGRDYMDGAAVRTTAGMAASVVTNKRGFSEHNYSVPVAGPLSLPPIVLPVPPYVLGAWLGDGETATARLTCCYLDGEILANIEAAGVTVQEQVSSGENVGRYLLGSAGRSQAARNGSLQARLRAIGVLNDKHIPTEYLRASIQQRMELLRGLMDADGYVSKAGQCEYTTILPQLAADVRELALSLGFKPTIALGRATLNGRDCGPKYRILFYAFADRPVFGLTRKRNRQMEPRPGMAKKLSRRYITAIRPVESVPVRCITVDSPSHLYLAGDTMIPTHNSPLAAGIALYGLMADGEKGAQIFSAATTRDQAKIVFNDGLRMAEHSPGLMDRLHKSVNNLAFQATGSFFRPLSADAATMDGLRVHIALVDELHEHPSSAVMDKLRTGMKSSQPLLFAITTAGYDRNSVCWQEHDHAVKVVEGTLESDAYFSFVAALDPDDPWTDETCWPKANPNLGVTVKLETLREECALAMQMPGQQNSFKRLRLNVWTEQSTRWIDLALWEAQGERTDPDDLAGRPCFAGLDLSTTSDITALVLYFPHPDGGGDVLPFFWVPEENMQKRAERDRVPYPLWAEQGFIEPTPGNYVDQDYIERRIIELGEKYNIREIAIDRWNAAQITTHLMAAGFTVVPFGQGYASMAAPTKETERLLLAHQVRHGGDPVLAWMASNAAVEEDAAGNQKASKARSTERIDGIVALIMSVGRASVHDGDDGGSVYETRDLLVLG